MRLKIIFLLASAILTINFTYPDNFSNTPDPEKSSDPAFLTCNSRWADSVLNSLTLRQRIGQLFMVAAFSNKDSAHIAYISGLIKDYNIGGLIFFQGGPVRQAMLTNQYQLIARVPLLIGIDGEWGLGMRLDSTVSFPRQMAWSAAGSEKQAYEIAKIIAMHCRRMGIHINFAPVADVNVNHLNPVIHTRSFGEDPEIVARYSLKYMEALQQEGIIATAKHFPGHGNTDGDSHFTLPTIKSSKEEMMKTELKPFDYLIKRGVQGVMVAHLSVPGFDTRKNLPSSLSDSIIYYLLIEKMGFKGLVITDALNMKGVSAMFQPGEAEIMALKAGNDILLYPQDVAKAVDAIEKAVKTGKISEKLINKSVFKILMAKKWAALDQYKPIEISNLKNDLNNVEAELAKRSMIHNSITVLKNDDELLPLKNLNKKRIAFALVGAKSVNDFYQQSQLYTEANAFVLPYQFDKKVRDSIEKVLLTYHLVIFSFHSLNTKTGLAYGFSPELLTLVDSVAAKRLVVTAFFGNPYPLIFFESNPDINAVIVAYDDMPLTQNIVSQSIFGAGLTSGKLPVNMGTFRAGYGYELNQIIRLQYTIPEEEKINPTSFLKVDSIVNDAITNKVFPGCQILFAKNGKVIFRKAYGYHNYDSTISTSLSDIYDLASVTKISATTLAVMKLYEEGKIDLDARVSQYLPQFSSRDKSKIKVIDLLTHQAGLKPWIPFYKQIIRNGSYDSVYCRKKPELGFSVRLADSVYLLTSFRDTIYKAICNSEIKNYGKYQYSDLGFILLQRIVENVSNTTLDEYVNENFYNPLGLYHTTYYPSILFDKGQIVETTIDTIFRFDTIHGYVHDPTAALIGGVAGHAGLFSNADEMAVLLQMMLWKGQYGGVRFLKPSTVEYFTKAHFVKKNNRRGIGFDKPEPDTSKISPVCSGSSLLSFGHTGFTGNMVWADPEYQSVYVFLSNRTYPSDSNNKLMEWNIRTKIQEIFLQACQLTGK